MPTGHAVAARVLDRTPRPSTFTELCGYLADGGGGYTLWIGAGAAIAATGGASRSWSDLVETLAAEATAKTSEARPGNWVALDYPEKLEWISGRLGHMGFRSRLRDLLVLSIGRERFKLDVQLDQAMIGARASSVVSFNIEHLTSISFAWGVGGSPILRTYLEHNEFAPSQITTAPGAIGGTVYFPHGLIDIEGNCVMTRSEYDKHSATLAASTAVSSCLGGDLLILGMSLGDRYLRNAILAGRRWIRDIYWVGESFEHREWARVAGVTCLPASHTTVWSMLAAAIVGADAARIPGGLAGNRLKLTKLIPENVDRILQVLAGMPDHIKSLAASMRADLQSTYIAQYSVDLGLGMPDVLTSRPELTRWLANVRT